MSDETEEIKAEEVPKESSVAVISPDGWIQTALDKGLSIEVLERLFAMKKEFDAQQAKKAFDEAMALFQSKCPTIKKTKKGGVTKEGVTAYFFAPIEDIVEQTKDLKAECGFSHITKTETLDNGVKVTMQVRHVAGHTETNSIEMPFLTQTGVMSSAQVVAGTRTFAARYAYCDAFGIMTGDDDNDAVTPSVLEEFDAITKDWKFKESYVLQIVEQYKSKAALRKYIISLPDEEQTAKFVELLKKFPEVTHRKLWIAYQKQTNESANKFITDLQTKLKGETK